MRRLVFCALHSSPLSGHTGVHNTFWRIAIRFWWPGMTVQIRQWVLECGHCHLATSTQTKAPVRGCTDTPPPTCSTLFT
eukprot:scaffold97687_cov39-Attheya_sp.AAC.1